MAANALVYLLLRSRGEPRCAGLLSKPGSPCHVLFCFVLFCFGLFFCLFFCFVFFCGVESTDLSGTNVLVRGAFTGKKTLLVKPP